MTMPAVCVIGSGFSGAVVAVELAAAGIDVLVLEAGTHDPDHRLDAMVDRVEISGRTELRFGFSRQLGGASNLWAGRIAPLEAIDFEPREWVPGSGWPFGRGELERHFARAAEILGIPGHEWFTHHGHTAPAFASTNHLELKPFQWARRPFDAGRHLEEAARRYPNLRVRTGSPVIALHERADANSVEAAEVAQPGGRTERVEAACFVVAAGGIETPRILLNSTSVRPAGIGNERGVVGRYLATHPKANVATLVLDRPVSTRHPLFMDHPLAPGVMRCGLGFTPAAQRERRLLNHYVQVLPFAEHRANRLFEAFRGAERFNSPLIDRSPLVAGYLTGAGRIAFEMIGRAGRVHPRTTKFVLRAFLDQFPNPDNRVTLSERTDGLGARLANVAWTFSADDRASVIRFFECLEDELRSRGVHGLRFDRLRAAVDWPLTGLHSHFIGTTRMGTDPATSVTDANCRVHGSTNLFIAGPSLFTTGGYANPVYTVVALALRLAEHLRTRVE
jgi:choline dehydrogenase-like flavoprotein